MNVTIDLILVVILAFAIIKNLLSGFVKAVLKQGRLILTFVITGAFGSAVADLLNEKLFGQMMYDTVHSGLSDSLGSAVGSVSAVSYESIPGFFKLFIDEQTFGSASSAGGSVIDSLSRAISEPMASLISTIVGHILLFAVTFILLTVAISIIGKVVSMSPLGALDKLLGAALGLICGALAVCFISAILYTVLSAMGNTDVYENSVVFKFICDLNLFGFIQK